MKGGGRMNCGIEAFVSEEALRLHKEHLEVLRLKYSVMEKSFPEIKNKSVDQIMRMRQKYKEEILDVRSKIICHELYFASFGEAYQSSASLRKDYRSEPSFLYELFCAAKDGDDDYIAVFSDKNKIKIKSLSKSTEILEIPNVLICIDLCEHAYFLDYGFDKKRYISNLLPYLNIAALDKILAISIEKRK